jgi:hypothetical protein
LKIVIPPPSKQQTGSMKVWSHQPPPSIQLRIGFTPSEANLALSSHSRNRTFPTSAMGR